MMIERDDYGRPFAVKDVTDIFLHERGFECGAPPPTPMERLMAEADSRREERESDELMGLDIRR